MITLLTRVAAQWRLASIAACLLLVRPVLAQQRATPVLFQEDAAARAAAQTSPLAALLRQARPFSLDPAAVRATLAAAPAEGSASGAPVVLALPLPDGTTARFALRETAVMPADLAARYPAIKTYSGIGLDDATASVRLSLDLGGLHAQVLAAGHEAYYIDPASLTDSQHYLSFRLSDQRQPAPGGGCAAPATVAAPTTATAQRGASAAATAARTAGNRLQTIRLAVATTDEYTAARGGTRASALAAVVATVNRINGLFERELSIRLLLVSNNEQIIARNTSAQADPYSNNNSPTTALRENQTHLDAVIGSANYNMGHLFGTIGGGYAMIGVVGQSNKAWAETGLWSPVGDAFDIQLVAHEMAHQMGAYHSFNSTAVGSCSPGNRQGNAAYEPGSGSTLMAYPGLCGSENLQGGRDAYFHTGSYEQLHARMFNGAYNTSGVATGNTVPSVQVPAGNKVLPIGTPFKLTATATDADGDALTYCWDQLDLGRAAALSTPQVPNDSVPLFRSWPPGSSPTRYFPRLSTLLNNGTDLAERLPTVSRQLSFSCLVRDLHAGPQGVVGGTNSSDLVQLRTTTAAGPFVLTAPNTNVTWPVGSTQPVTWNVAGTDANGVDCATVNLRLSTDGGLTYPTVLLANAPNNGAAVVTVPPMPGTRARLMVEAADNYFFDISNQNFTIVPVAVLTPSLSDLSPAGGPVGTAFTVSGSNLTTPTAVTMGGLRIPFSNATATSLRLTVPDSVASPAAVVVSTSAGTSNALAFTITPLISSLSPSSGFTPNPVQLGTTVVVAGSGLVGATEVRFNGMLVNNFAVNAAGTAITFTVPGGATTGPVTVLTPGGTATSPGPFTVLERPCELPVVNLINMTAVTAQFTFSANPAAPRFYLATLTPGNRTDTIWTAAGFTYNTLTPGTTYTFTLRSYCAATRQSPLITLRFTTPLGGFGSNDECATAAPVVPGAPGESCTPTGSSFSRITESMPPAQCSGFTAVRALDAWFRFVATGPVHTVTVTGSADGVLEVFGGSCSNLTSLQCVDGAAGGGESLTLTTLIPGNTYWFRYYYRSTGGSYFAACVTTPAPVSATCPAPTNVLISNITASSARVSFTPSVPGSQYVVSTTPYSTPQTVSAGPVLLSNLRDGTTYTVSIASACPDSTFSAPALAGFTTEYPDLVINDYAAIPLRAYRNVTVTGDGYGMVEDLGPASRSLVIMGTLRVQRGGYFSSNNRLVTGPGNFVLEPGATLIIHSLQGISQSGATGSVQVTGSRLFGRHANYEYDVPPTAPAITGSGLPDTVRAVSFYGTPNYPFTLSNHLTVRNELLLLGGSLHLGSSNLTLLSDSHGTASLFNDDFNAVVNTGTGRVTVQRYASPSTSYRGPGYRHYSSPLQAATVAGLAVPGQFAPLVNAAYNALPTPALPAGQFPTVFRYAESRLTAAFPGFDTGWESPASPAEVLTPGRGYTVNIAPSATVALTGALNCAAVNTGPLLRGSGPNAGWHLLGNPFPSPLFLGEYFNDSLPAGLARAMYLFEPSSQYGGFYRSFVNGIGTDGSTYLQVPVMQGFFMRATQNVPGGLTFPNYLRISSLDSGNFHRSAGVARLPRPTLRLTLAGTTTQGTDHTVVYFENGATASGTDDNYDAAKLNNPSALLQLATQMPGPGNEPLAINGLPDLTARADTRVPLTLYLAAPGAYQLRVAELTNFDPSVPVWLLDHARGTRSDLRQQPAYGFSAAQAGPLNGRFELLLGRAGTALASATAVSRSFSLWPNPVAPGGTLHLTLDAPAPQATATLTTLLGQPVRQLSFGGSAGAVPTAGLAPGTYLLVVQAAGQATCTRRVVLE